MSRKPRVLSQTGIYHVMLRGVNRQPIFEQEDDYQKFVFILHDMVSPKDEFKRPMPPRCVIYAYCLMPNHVHLLIQEKEESIAEVMKKVATRYAMYYNYKYEHYGHLFQDRFKSEPVNDEAYFLTLLRYIHQNPVAGRLCRQVEDYDWSSWWEYINSPHRRASICSTHLVLNRYPLNDLIEQVNTPLLKAQQVIEFDRYRGTVPNDTVINFLKYTYHIRRPQDLHRLPKGQRNEILAAAKDLGAGLSQLSRLTSFSTYIISQARKNRKPPL